MEWLLLGLGILFVLLGLLGAILPVIPGPPLSFAGLLCLHFTGWAEYSIQFLVVMGLIALVVTLVDYYVPIWGTRKFGGSRMGMIGSTVGLILGVVLFPPLGVILGPFLGAMLAEILRDHRDVRRAFRSGIGSPVGFLMGTGLKLSASVLMTYYFVQPWI